MVLRWRMRIRKALLSSDKVASKVAKVEKDTEGDEDENLLAEMEELTQVLERKKKKAKKLLEKRRAKDKTRKALGIQIDATKDSYFDKQLFSLTAIKVCDYFIILLYTVIHMANVSGGLSLFGSRNFISKLIHLIAFARTSFGFLSMAYF